MSLQAITDKAVGLINTHPAPDYKIVVDGTDITASLDGRLISLTITDNRGFEADSLDLALDDTDGKLALPPRGATIRVAIGWKDSPLVDKGTFTVDDVEHAGSPDTLTIRARSADLRTGLSTQRERSWHGVTLGDVVCTIAGECDLVPAVSDALAGEKIKHLDQTNESGANLLTRLARQFDAISTVKNGRLIFTGAAGGVSVSGKALPAIHITREDGDQHRFAIADREAYTAVRATYDDLNAGTKGEVTWGADEDAIERGAPRKVAKAPAAGQYKDAGQIFKTRDAAQRAARKQWRALAANKAARAAWVGVKARYDNRNLSVSGEVTYGQADEDAARAKALRLANKDAGKTGEPTPIDHSADNTKTLRHVYATKENAKRAARAEWRRLQRGMATFSLVLARGRPEMLTDAPVTVRGWKPQIDSTDWVSTRIVHTIADGGFTTAPEMEIRATEIPD